jgi:hypothetical protein
MAKFFGKTPERGRKPDASAGASSRPANLSKPVITSDEDKALLSRQAPKSMPEKAYPREKEGVSGVPSGTGQEQLDNSGDRFHAMMNRTKQMLAETLESDQSLQKGSMEEPSVDWDAGKAAYRQHSAFRSDEKPAHQDSFNDTDLLDTNGKNVLGNSNVYYERINFLSEKLNRCQRLQRLLLAAVIFATAVNLVLLVL